ncbi:MAG: translation elongation factor Ts [Gemmatimonadota bacterium]|nr:translation elongation factor Ts [Gemmatimonadota bacterium]
MAVSAANVKQLRDKTGAGMMDCKRALEESGGDIEKSISYLREQGMLAASKKSSREAKEGLIHTYLHQGSRIGAMVELNCETDFVARNDAFQGLARDIAMQVAAAKPISVNRDQVSTELIEKEKEIYSNQAKNEGKPEHIVDRIIDGRVEKYYQENCLLEQPFIRDTDKTIQDLITDAVGNLGENIVVRRFVRFELGAE